MRRKKIVLVNQVAGYLFIDVANAFAERYEEVILFAGDVIPLNEPLNPKIKIEPIAKYDRANTKKRIISWVIAFFNIWRLLVFKYKKYDVLLSSNPPVASTLIPLLMNRNVSLLIYDIYPEGLVAGKFVTKDNLLYRFWAFLNKKAYKRVRKVMTLTEGMASGLASYVDKEKIAIVPAWASSFGQVDELPADKNLFIEKYNLQGKFIIMYSGNLGKEYELEALIELANEFVEFSDIMFIIMGKGWKAESLNSLIKDKGLSNCIWLPYQTAELFNHSLRAFQVGVVALAAAVSKVAIPSKTYNLLAVGRPVFCIGDEDSSLANFLKKNEIGAAFEANRIGAMKLFISKMYNDKVYFECLCRNATAIGAKFTKTLAHQIVDLTELNENNS